MPNNRTEILQIRAPEEIEEFSREIGVWASEELTVDLSNIQNIEIAKLQFIECYQSSGDTLNLKGLNIHKIPPMMRKLNHLRNLILRNNPSLNLDSFCNLAELINLETLSLYNNQSPNIANYIPLELVNLRVLSLDRNRITEFPNHILYFTNLRNLSLGNNLITSIPDDISRLQQLEIFTISQNQLTTIPVLQLNSIQSLIELDVIQNGIYNQDRQFESIIISGLDNLDRRIEVSRDLINNRVLVTVDQNSNQTQDIKREATPDFINNLIIFSKFSHEELASSNTSLIGIQQDSSSTNSQNLTLKFGEIMEFYFGSPSDSGEINNEQKQSILKALRKFTESPIFTRMHEDFKKQLFRELLGILCQIYKQKDNADLMNNYQDIAIDSLEDCDDRNIFMIFQLKNLCNKLDSTQVSELLGLDPKDQFFNYLSQQIIFFKIINLASLQVENIKKSNPAFTEDIEVYLNYIRVFNNEFGSKFSLNLPSISTQLYFQDYPDFRVNPIELAKLNEIYNANQEGNFRPLFKMLAQSIAIDSYRNVNEKNPEINKQNFIISIKQEIDLIALDFISDLLNSLTSSDNPSSDEDIKKIICKDIEKQQISTLKEILFEQLMAIKENRELITSLTEDKVDEITQKFKEIYFTSLKENGNGRTTDLLTLENASAIASSRPSSPRPTEVSAEARSSASQRSQSRSPSPR